MEFKTVIQEQMHTKNVYFCTKPIPGNALNAKWFGYYNFQLK